MTKLFILGECYMAYSFERLLSKIPIVTLSHYCRITGMYKFCVKTYGKKMHLFRKECFYYELVSLHSTQICAG